MFFNHNSHSVDEKLLLSAVTFYLSFSLPPLLCMLPYVRVCVLTRHFIQITHTLYFTFHFCTSTGDRGLEVRGHGGGSHVPVDLCGRLCGGHLGPVPAACFPESHHSTRRAAHI